jgi:fructose-1,6-bisphosphatase/inositol monophosphatase family enzyme
VTDWLALCRGASEDVRGVLGELRTRRDREPVVGHGEGGDETTAIDAAAERVVLERFRAVDSVTVVSEEAGELDAGGRDALGGLARAAAELCLARSEPAQLLRERARAHRARVGTRAQRRLEAIVRDACKRFDEPCRDPREGDGDRITRGRVGSFGDRR